MKTLEMISKTNLDIPQAIVWYIADIMESKGKQDLFKSQSAQKLKSLRESSIIESSVSSNRIEGVEIEQNRIKPVLIGNKHLKDRNEEELRGYRKALEWIHSKGKKIPVTTKTVLELHRFVRAEAGDAGKFKTKEGEGDILEILPDGSKKLRFKTAPPNEVKMQMEKWETMNAELIKSGRVHPLIILSSVNFDFLCIHPFRDGNGRVSRLLLLLQCYHLDLEVGRYISLEKLIEENKEGYYKALEDSSLSWHQGKHDPFPIIRFLLYILKTAFKDFESRMLKMPEPKGVKTASVIQWIQNQRVSFTLEDLRKAHPSVSVELIRKILKSLSKEKRVRSIGKGKGAKWEIPE